MGLGWQELTIILVIVIIIFGAGKLPEIGGALGKGIKEFKTNASEDQIAAKSTSSNADTTATASTNAKTPQPVRADLREMRADEI